MSAERDEDPLRGISNSLGAFRKVRSRFLAASNGLVLVQMQVNYPNNGRALLAGPSDLDSFSKDLRNRYLTYVWNAHLLLVSAEEIYNRHLGDETFPEYVSRKPDKTKGLPVLVFDLFDIARRDAEFTFVPRSVPLRRLKSGRWLDLDFVLDLDQVRGFYARDGAREYAMSLSTDLSLSELQSEFTGLIVEFFDWFLSEMRRLTLLQMGRLENL